MSVFDSLHPKLLGVLRTLGVEEPTPAQRSAMPAVSAGKHLLLIAPTGIGKTEAAVLPLLDRIVRTQPPGIALLYITPLRALNRDMLRRMEIFGQGLGITVGVRHGDTPEGERQRQASVPPQFLITTPETLQIMFMGWKLRAALSRVRWVVVDEIHEMAMDERGAQLAVGLERLVDIAGEFQRVGLSATVGDHEEVARFLGGAGREVEVINITFPKGMRISVHTPAVTEEDKAVAIDIHAEPEVCAAMRLSRAMIEKRRSTLFFVNTRDTAEYLASRYALLDPEFKIGVHHGSLSRHVRVEAEEEFKHERLKALICTSSLELGIDVGAADFTIQFGSPRMVSRLVQRVGRAGHSMRLVSEGVIITQGFDDILESAVICGRALAGKIDALGSREQPLSVLANQISAYAAAEPGADPERLYRILQRAHPFRGLAKDEFDAVVNFLRAVKILRPEGKEMARSKRTLEYFYENISMIPDERRYRVIDITTRRPIGTLDESFVASFSDLERPFIVRGRPWHIVEVEEDRVMVEPVSTIGVVPSWFGEEIPVPYEVAQEVGVLRRTLDWQGYHTFREGRREVEEGIAQQRGSGFIVPDDRQIVIECEGEVILMHACFGTKVNETLGRILSMLLAARRGESVGLYTDPYRIVFEGGGRLLGSEIRSALEELTPEALPSLARLAARRSQTFRWRFVHVAKKFGVLRKDADYRAINLGALLEAYSSTPLMREAVDKTLWDEMDVERTKEIVQKLKDGKIEICEQRLSPIGRIGLEKRMELVSPTRPSKAILDALKLRLESMEVALLCLNCRRPRRTRISALDPKVRCAYCSSSMVAALPPFEKDKAKLLAKRVRTAEEEKEMKILAKSANLVRVHGKKAVMVLAGRGIGPTTAARILSRIYLNEGELLAKVLEAEINYAKTKRFWD
ncbi:MAG: DEAD/DEAH box helicase [Candidatus Thermoplasmatota archaeon]